MPKGIYKHKSLSIETRKKMSEAKKGKMPSFIPNNKGRKLSLETKNKISLAKKGKPTWLSKQVKKGVCFNTGRTHFKKGVSSWSKGKKCPQRAGEKHYNWKGGITAKNKLIRHGIEFRLWREAVFARDNFTCQDCGQRGGDLEAHHIKSFANFPELRTAIENGITYCIKCHGKNDKYRGKVNQ